MRSVNNGEAIYFDALDLAVKIHEVKNNGGKVLQGLRCKFFPLAKISRTWRGKVKVVFYPARS
jgi:hypothetical protein